MIPLKLSLQGLYSYRDTIEIDFSRLCEGRLFGIFGPVGSGKSAILEAITYALYGETERLNNKDGRSYNMMNLKSSLMKVDFEFKAGDPVNRYRFTVELKRNSKRFYDVGTPKRLAYQHDGLAWVPMQNADASNILGLSYDHFIKTIIIPQGRFQDFLSMGPTDRSKMLKEIFELHRFDLSAPTKTLLDKNKSEWDEVKGKLGEIPDIDQSHIDAHTQRLDHLEAEIKTGDERQKDLSIQLQQMEQLKSLIGELTEIEEFIEEYAEDEPEYDARETRLNRYLLAQQRFEDLMAQEDRHHTTLKEANTTQQKHREDLDKLSLLLQKVEAEFEEAKRRYEGRENLSLREQEMRRMGEMRKLDTELENLQARLAKGKPMVRDKEKEVEAQKATISQLSTQLSTQKQAQPDTFRLSELLAWHRETTHLQTRLSEANTVQSQAQTAHTAADQEVQALLQGPLGDPDQAETQLAEARTQLHARLTDLQTQLRLTEFAHALEDGQPCPLCGALSHPHPMHLGNTEQEVQSVNAELQGIETQFTALHTLRKSLAASQARLSERALALQQAAQNQATAQAALQVHNAAYKWPDFPQDQPQAALAAQEQAKATAQALHQAEATLDKQRKDLEENEKTILKYNEGVQKLETEIATVQAKFDTLKTQIHIFDYAKDRHHDIAHFVGKADHFKEEYESVTHAYERADQQRLQTRDRFGTLNTNLQLAQQTAERAQQELSTLSEQISQRLQDSPFEDRAAIRLTLTQKINVLEEREEIDVYRTRIAAARTELQTKRAQVGDRQYSASEHLALTDTLQTLQAQLKLLTEEKGKLRNELQTLKDQLARRQTLADRHHYLSTRAEDLDTLAKLFKANGFVDYVSSVYLRELCQRANERFSALTRNRLSLEINDENTFQIRDMVNGGQVRSVKTLSGGQTFQASLSLALALADNIQQRNKSAYNFFFLDEGFGSLDKDSLQVVFDTLKALRRENRVVGVISHVEELQQEIDTYLSIRQDDERGSLVKPSWGVPN